MGTRSRIDKKCSELKRRSQNSPGTLLNAPKKIPGALWEHAGNVGKMVRGSPGSSQQKLSDCPRKHPRIFREHRGVNPGQNEAIAYYNFV